MAGSGDEMAGSAGPGRLRASDADRERAVDVLKAAFVRGQLAKDEFDLRVGQALTSRTCGDLYALTAGIPAGPSTVQPPEPEGKAFTACAVAGLRGAGAWAARTPLRRPAFFIAGALLLFGGMLLGNPVVFMAGVFVIGAAVPDRSPGTATTAMVWTWQWPHKNQR